MKKTIKRNDPKTLNRLIHAEVELRASSYKDLDDKSASVEIVVASGAPVYREKWDESKGWVPYERRLNISKDSIRLNRFTKCSSVLNNHQNGSWGESVRDTLGYVESAWIEEKHGGGAELIARVILSKITKEDREIAEKVKYKFIRSVSVGAEVFNETDVTGDDDDVQQLLVDDWEPHEVSFVMIPADPNCIVRSLNPSNRNLSMSAKAKTKNLLHQFAEGTATLAEMEELRNLLKQGNIKRAEDDGDDGGTDEDTLEEGEAASAAADAAATVADDISVEVTPEEEEAIATAIEEVIEDVVDTSSDDTGGDDDDTGDIALSRNRKIARIKEGIFRRVKPMRIQRNRRSGMRVQSARGSHALENENRMVLLNKMSHAFADHLTSGLFYKNEERERGSEAVVERSKNEFVGQLKIQRMARNLLAHHGVEKVWELRNSDVYNMISGGYETVGKNIVQRSGAPMMVSSDFQNLFSTSMNASILASYEWRRGEQTFDGWVKRTQPEDFQEQELIWVGESGTLKLVLPGADAPVQKITDGKEEYKLASYAKIHELTRQAVVNDRTGELMAVLLSGKAAADIETDLVFDQLHNGTWGGTATFSAARGNLTTGAQYALLNTTNPFGGIEKIDVGLATIKSDDDDGKPMGFTLQYLLVPPQLKAKALQSQSKEFTATQPGGVNPFTYEVRVEPRLSDYSTTAYFGIASEAGVFRNFIELGTLSNTPITKTDERFENDVLRFKLAHDCGAKILDYRLAHKVTGAA